MNLDEVPSPFPLHPALPPLSCSPFPLSLPCSASVCVGGGGRGWGGDCATRVQQWRLRACGLHMPKASALHMRKAYGLRSVP